MRGTVAKRLRKQVYGDEPESDFGYNVAVFIRTRRGRHGPISVLRPIRMCEGKRGVYQALKKGYYKRKGKGESEVL